MSRIAFLSLLSLVACFGETEEAPAPPPAAAQAQAEAAAPAPAADAQAAERALAPSPLDLAKGVKGAGLNTALATLVPDRSFEMEAGSTDMAAVRTGVVIADAILGGEDADKALFLRRLQQARAGMVRLGMKEGQGVLNEVDGFIAAVENDTASRADFIASLDAIIQTKVPEESWAPGDTTGPLLQAGAWLAGTNLVAKSIVAEDNAAAAGALLREEAVVDYFIQYVRAEGSDKAPDAIVEELTRTLGVLKEVAGKPTLGVADAQAVADATDKLLGQL